MHPGFLEARELPCDAVKVQSARVATWYREKSCSDIVNDASLAKNRA